MFTGERTELSAISQTVPPLLTIFSAIFKLPGYPAQSATTRADVASQPFIQPGSPMSFAICS